MTKPFEPRKLVLFYPADDLVTDIYVSTGWLRKYQKEEARKARKFTRKRRKQFNESWNKPYDLNDYDHFGDELDW